MGHPVYIKFYFKVYLFLYVLILCVHIKYVIAQNIHKAKSEKIELFKN